VSLKLELVPHLDPSPTPKTEGLNSSSKVQLTLTILSHRQCRAVGRVLVASNMEILGLQLAQKHCGIELQEIAGIEPSNMAIDYY